MALYTYNALGKDGKRHTGQLDAQSMQGVRDQITKMGLYPVRIQLSSESSKSEWSFANLFAGSITIKDKVFFTKQLAVLLKSGVPLLDALELLSEQTEGRLKLITIKLKDDLKEGRAFADALAQFPKTFDRTYVQLVKAGEASGKLEPILDRLSAYLERQDEIRKKINSAIRGPLMQLGLVFAVTAGMLVFIVPQIQEVYKESTSELPLATQILTLLSDFLVGYYWLLVLIVGGLYAAFYAWSSTERGAYQWDLFKLKIPIVKTFVRTKAVAQFSRTLGMLVESGVNLAEALTIVTAIVDNRVLVHKLNEARDNIIKQGRIAEYLKQTGLFPPMAIYLINTGEQSGALDTMLLTVADTYETDLNELSDGLTAKLNPIMLMVVAGIISFIIMAVIMPVMELGSKIS